MLEVSEADNGEFTDAIYECDAGKKLMAFYYKTGVDTFEPEFATKLGTTIFPVCLECIRSNL